MMVGVLKIELALFEAHSLKDKRRVVNGLKERLRQRFNVSVSEVDHADAARRCTLGVAMVSGATRPMHAQFDQIIEAIRSTAGATLLQYDREFL